MAPRAKSAAFIVDGVQCSVELKSRVVTVGTTRLVGNDEHDRFKLPVGVPIEPRERLEAQVSERAHGRPKFAALAARAARADPMPMQVDIDKVVAAAGSAGISQRPRCSCAGRGGTCRCLSSCSRQKLCVTM